MIQLCCGETVRIDPKQYIKVDKFIKPLNTFLPNQIQKTSSKPFMPNDSINQCGCASYSHVISPSQKVLFNSFASPNVYSHDSHIETTTKYSKQCQICENEKMDVFHRYQCSKCLKMIKLCNTCSLNHDVHTDLLKKIDEQNKKIDTLVKTIQEFIEKDKTIV